MMDFGSFDAPLFDGVFSLPIDLGETGHGTDAALSNKAVISVLESALAIDVAGQSSGTVSATSITSSIDGSTKTPATRGTIVALTTGALVMFYQAGSESPTGLAYRISNDGGVTWSSPTQIDSTTSYFPSAVVQRNTNDIHLVYSKDESSPTVGTTQSVYYRRFIYTGTAGDAAFTMGSAITLMAGTANIAYERASIAIDDNYVPFCVALRYSDNSSPTYAISCAIGAVSGNLAGAAIVTNSTGLNVQTADISLAPTHLGTQWFVAISAGGTVWLTRAVGPNVGQSTITFSSVNSFGTDAGHVIACQGHPMGTYVYVAYIKNTHAYVIKWNNTTGTMGTAVDLGIGTRVGLGHDTLSAFAYLIQRVSSTQYAGFAKETSSWAVSVITSSGAETWDWPNGALRVDDAQTVAIAWSQTGGAPNKVYVASSRYPIAKSLSDSSSGTETISNKRSLTELQPVIESLNVGVYGPDGNAAFVDDVTAIGSPKITETVLAEFLINSIRTIAETSTGTESPNILPPTQADTGVGTDDASQKNKVGDNDSSTGTESVRNVRYGTDVAAFADAISNIGRLVAEAVSGIETLTNGRVSNQAVTVTDVAKLTPIVTDTGTATEILSRVIELLEGMSAADIITAISRTLAESSTGTDTLKRSNEISESGSALDTADETTRAVSVLLRLLITKSSIRLRTEGA